MGNFTLNGVEVSPEPSDFLPTRTRIEQADRTFNGSYVADVITYKMAFDLTFKVLTGTEIAPYLDLYDAGTFISFTYPEAGSTQTKTVRVADISPTLKKYEYTTSIEYWYDVRLQLVEQ